MAADNASLNGLLAWAIENSNSTSTTTIDPSHPTTTPNTTTAPTTNGAHRAPAPNAKAIAELLGMPSDAQLMREWMAAITAPLTDVDLENKLTAFDNFEQTIEQLDNANNIEKLGLWPPLIAQLKSEEAELRRMAAWCCSVAVQNNLKSQEFFLARGGVEELARLAVGDGDAGVRKKAIGALSSEVRNFQPGMDRLVGVLPEEVWRRGVTAVDAYDMERCSEVIDALRAHSAGRT